MAEPTHLFRYRPAVLAVTGVAALCGIYIVYSSLAELSTENRLHRSNTVHRPRRQLVIAVTSPDGLRAPFGLLQPLPSKEELREAVGQVSENDMRLMEALAVHSILNACLTARNAPQRDLMHGLGLDGLPEALEARQVDDIRHRSAQIASLLPGLDKANMDQAIEHFLANLVATEMEYPEETIPDEAEEFDGTDGAPKEPSQPLKSLLYYIAEEDARRKAYEHRGIHCEECGEGPIRGVRYHCLNCPDYDLCSTCEMQTAHIRTHVMVKIKIPIPVLSQPTKAHPLWYPGDPRKIHPSLSAGVRKRLAIETGFEEPKIDALYDQFTCIANVPWPQDPLKVQAAIDRRAFNKALTSENWINRFAPNAIHDRMFAFYDTNHDECIGFEEFLSGVTYLRGPKRFTSLRRALRGFDFDNDGLVSRKDFMRLFKAKYAIQKRIVSDMVQAHEDEQTYYAMEVLRSSQPISSLFNQEEIPQGEEMPRHGKRMDRHGDMQPLPGAKTILDDDDMLPSVPGDARHTAIHGTSSTEGSLSREDLRSQALQLEEILYGSLGPQGIQPEARQQQIGRMSTADETQRSSVPASKDKCPAQDDSPAFGTQDWDPLLVAIEDGFRQLLDPLFEAKEAEGREIVATHSERLRWRREIDEAEMQKRAFQEELKQGAKVDPLMATALKSFGSLKVERKTDEGVGSDLRNVFVPTDPESLAQREAEISQRPLEDLLASTGYGTIETDLISERESATPSNNKTPSHEDELVHAQDKVIDSTMPQFRPDDPTPTVAETPPSKERLEYLSTLDDAEIAADARGGPGKLTFDEIEAMVEADSTRELFGLVTSWLEWASF